MTVPRTDVRILLDHFAATLEHVIENPRSSISALDLTSLGERLLLHEYGKAAVRARSGLVQSLVEEQARLRPDAHAVQFELDAPLTYSMLNNRANQLGRLLHLEGASYIAVHMRISSDFIVALLAILKAGAAYVVLDPDAPDSRKSSIVEDVRAEFVLVDASTTGKFPRELEVRDLLSQSMGNEHSNLVTNHDANGVAYVIYTSGSTGRPKAALIEHEAAFNGLLAFPRMPDLRQLLFFNPAFSAAQRSIWGRMRRRFLCLNEIYNVRRELASIVGPNMLLYATQNMHHS